MKSINSYNERSPIMLCQKCGNELIVKDFEYRVGWVCVHCHMGGSITKMIKDKEKELLSLIERS